MAGSKKFNYLVAKTLHWFAGFIIAFNLMSGWRVGDFPEHKHILIMIHSGIGTTIFLLMLLRWWWRKKNKLYAPPRWWKRPSMVLQWVFYPLLLIQPLLGVGLAAFISYEVLAFGFINYSALAADSVEMQEIMFQLHGSTAILLIVLILIHGMERSRQFFTD